MKISDKVANEMLIIT